MQGYRTIIFNLIMVAGGLLGLTIAPEQASAYADAFILLWGFGNVVFRAITHTPIFKSKEQVAVEKPVPPTTAAAIIFALVVASQLLSACAGMEVPTTPRQQLLAIEYSYAAAVRTETSLVADGIIPASEVASLDALQSGTGTALAAAEAAVKSNQPAGNLIGAANAALIKLLEYLEAQKANGKGSTSSGSIDRTLDAFAERDGGSGSSSADPTCRPHGGAGCHGRRIGHRDPNSDLGRG
jgi:hypothetical protein